MLNKIKNSIFLISILLLISSCDSIKEIDSKEIKVSYDNGNLYCKGSRRSYKKRAKTFENRIGIWNFYYPDKTLELQIEYDNEGGIPSYKKYSQDGIISISYTYTELDENLVINKIYYYETGELQQESIYKYVSEIDDESNEYDIESETIKTYYKKGNIFQHTEYEDDTLINKKRWDENNDLILELEYKDGLISEELLKSEINE